MRSGHILKTKLHPSTVPFACADQNLRINRTKIPVGVHQNLIGPESHQGGRTIRSMGNHDGKVIRSFA
jgi:hypothetical protein